MRFYKFTLNTTRFEITPPAEGFARGAREARDDMKCFVRHAIEEVNETDVDKSYLFACDINSTSVKLGVMCRGNGEPESKVDKFMQLLDIKTDRISKEEITFRAFDEILNRAQRINLMEFDCNDDFYDELGVKDISDIRYAGEEILKERTDGEIEDLSAKLTTDKELRKEFDRIKKNGHTAFIGHPVHYFVETDNKDERRETCRMLLASLYNAGRLFSKRYYYTDYSYFASRSSVDAFIDIYESIEGGTIIVRFDKDDLENESNRAGELRRFIEGISEIIKKYRNKVLTVICLPKASEKIRNMLSDYLSTMSFVSIKDSLLSGEEAIKYLERICGEKTGVAADDSLRELVKDGMVYDSVDLNNMLDVWLDGKLKNSIYPSYSDVDAISATSEKAEVAGDSFAELDEMIGLTSAKELIKRAVDSFRAQEIFGKRGLARDDFSRHMIFTGNPGTAKTTVARLFANILRDNGIISKGQLVEVGRGDLVGKYVGWTADIVKKKFRDARGGVLFIDEAYSLVDDRDGLYGDEAINTIVQEMENHRDDVIVIFAGYPDKMEKFIKKNPGLRSRIAFHVRFDDYDVKELCAIASLFARKKGVEIEKKGMEKLEHIFAKACKSSDFGNGRYVRNVIEQALMAQSSRLVNMPFEKVTVKEIKTIKAVDIIEPDIGGAIERPSIGFCA